MLSLGSPHEARELIRSWLVLAGDVRVDVALRSMHESIAREVSTHRPICLASGRCCAFREHGHDLLVTGLEAAWSWLHLVQRPSSRSTRVGVSIGKCPLLDGSACGEHAARPGPCRVYFCDRSAEEWSTHLGERSHQAVRKLHDEVGAAYRYCRFTELLDALAASESELPGALARSEDAS
ncbi:MAG: hypothetical protein EXS00_03380 [Phycisphaerales bacterium]|nr:hypothetical protein [Phycisphaerales bacterium]